MQRRAATMAFAASMYAFPGGSVDDRDSAPVGWVGPTPAWWAIRFGLPETDAQAVVCAAIREVFEECGVLLAGPDDSTVVRDVSSEDWEQARLALLAREVALVDVLGSRGLRVRADLLAAWDRWLTPEFEPRRFDTFFFLARLPDGQRTRDLGGESDHSAWLSPAEAAKLPMLPPTRYTLERLAQVGRVEDAVAMGAQRDLSRPVLPRVESDTDGDWLVLDR